MFYKFKIRAKKDTPNGEKEVTEEYLIDCDLFAEAEAAGLQLYNGKGDVIAISRSNVKEIVNPSTKDKAAYFRATIVDTFVSDNGDEKELKYKVLVAADTVAEATKLVNEYMQQGLDDMRLEGINQTKILEIL